MYNLFNPSLSKLPYLPLSPIWLLHLTTSSYVGISAKAKQLVDVIRENPYQNPPRFEKLVGKLDGLLSRRISILHRLVYQVFTEPFTEGETDYQGIIKIVRMWTHYDDVR